MSPGTQPGSITPSYSTPSPSPASSRAFPPRRPTSLPRSRRSSTPASPALFGEEICNQSENRGGGLDTGADEGYAKRGGSSSAGNAPYWAEGSPMNRRSRMQEEEKKAQGSKQEESMSSNSNDQTRRDPNNRTSRRESMENEENREGRKKSIEQDHARNSSGPVTRWGKSITISQICLFINTYFLSTLYKILS